MEIIFSEENMPEKAVTDKMKEAAELCLEREGVDPEGIEISVSFVESEEIREINKVYRNNDSVTDVLSFPQFEDPEEIRQIQCPEQDAGDEEDAEEETFYDEGPESVLLGDVIICVKRAEEQAAEFGHSIERELVYLFVHSMFHLLGYDHMEEDEKKLMRQAEEEIMSRIKVER